MKRVLALALVGGALLLGGCDRSTAAPPSTPAAPPAAAQAASRAASPAASPAASSGRTDNVDSLLNDVDKQLSSDDQPPADQD